MKILKISLILFVFATIFSCQKEDIEVAIPKTQNQELSKEAKATLDYLLSVGYNEKDLTHDVEAKGFAYEDILYPYGFYKDIDEATPGNKNTIYNKKVTVANSNSITYFLDSTYPTTDAYVNAINWAKYYWDISSDNISITRVYSSSQADIICSGIHAAPKLFFAVAGYPSAGNVGGTLKVNLDNMGTDFNSNMALLMHELGHNLGFGHADVATPTGFEFITNTHDSAWHVANKCGSIMRSSVAACGWKPDGVRVWSSDDIISINRNYTYKI